MTTDSKPASHRTEHDFLGEMQIPFNAYWGVHTARGRQLSYLRHSYIRHARFNSRFWTG